MDSRHRKLHSDKQRPAPTFWPRTNALGLVMSVVVRTPEGKDRMISKGAPYTKQDEVDLILNGYIAFLDPPKETATLAIKALESHGVFVKVVIRCRDQRRYRSRYRSRYCKRVCRHDLA